MPIDFPTGASNGQVYTYNGKTWVYTSSTQAWNILPDQLNISEFLLMGA